MTVKTLADRYSLHFGANCGSSNWGAPQRSDNREPMK
jgi:hypothetical protein